MTDQELVGARPGRGPGRLRHSWSGTIEKRIYTLALRMTGSREDAPRSGPGCLFPGVESPPHLSGGEQLCHLALPPGHQPVPGLICGRQKRRHPVHGARRLPGRRGKRARPGEPPTSGSSPHGGGGALRAPPGPGAGAGRPCPEAPPAGADHAGAVRPLLPGDCRRSWTWIWGL